MALRDNIVGAWIPGKSGTGQLHLDQSGYGTHLQWVSPTANYWEANQAGWTPRTRATSDYLTASRAIPVTVSRWSVVHWVRLNSRNDGNFPNSMDGNFATNSNIGPRLELTASAAWVYSAGTGLVGISGGTTIANGVWACYVITHDGNVTAKTYSQGIPTGAVQSNISGATGAFTGRFTNVNLGRGFNSGRQIDGLIGGTVIFGRQLSDAEVWQIWLSGPSCDWFVKRRRRVFGYIPPTFRAAWVQRGKLIGGGV